MHLSAHLMILIVAASLAATGAVCAPLTDHDRARLLAAYPDRLSRVDGNDLVWSDGARMSIDDGKGEKPFAQWLNAPDIGDMFAIRYPAGADASPPAENADPGRARNTALFDKLYGDCRKGEVEKNLVRVNWLPGRSKQRLPFNRLNGAAAALAAVSRDLESLPRTVDVFLVPSAGTYNCRVIAGTDRVSAHGYGIAIDIALKHAHYWRNAAAGHNGPVTYRNEIPMDVLRVFERHGFIWGGRWYHYDTMHFEYRPELLGVAPRPTAASP